MKKLGLFLFYLCVTQGGFAQSNASSSQNRKGQFYFYWGWNRAWYTHSNLHFEGQNYDFTLQNVIAKDRQTPFSIKTYFGPTTLSIPQYNFRVGYFLKKKYSISFGTDHMKYVVQQGQTVKISGQIANSSTIYDKTYQNEDITIKKGFLELEHTDGLNYFNIDVRRHHDLINIGKTNLHFSEGIGFGGLYPRTDATLLNNPRNDKFHLTGFGASVLASLNATFYKHFFIQTELKGGFVDMPYLKTTMSEADKAQQYFFFTQLNIVFGCYLNVKK